MLVGRGFMENQEEDERRESSFSKIQRLLYTEVSIHPNYLEQNALWRHISNMFSASGVS